jgi:hypothetical protein
MPPEPLQHTTDFNPGRIATTVSKHDEEFISVKKRLDDLECKFGNNEKIAETLFETASKQTRMEEMFANVFTKLVSRDANVRTALISLMDTNEQSKIKLLWKQLGGKVLAVITFICGIIITILIQNYLQK